jgi:GrpB-like predicted nucleotidyltransferase (UPF0157 family)
MKIKIMPYSAQWPHLYDKASQTIKKALGKNCVDTHHVGSTSVPGLSAKPIIDIIACVHSLHFDHDHLIHLQYTYKGGFNLPFRKCFTYRGHPMDINLHVFEQDDPEIELNLNFRNHLRNHATDRAQYDALKDQLAAQDHAHEKNGNMLKAYTMGKNDFIQDILRRSNFDRLRCTLCVHDAEWSFIQRIAQSNNKTGIIKNDASHIYFIFYQGVEKIGYAHIHVESKAHASLMDMIIDTPHPQIEYTKKFLSLIHKWSLFQSCHLSFPHP